MKSWKEQIERQARLLISEIASLERQIDPSKSTGSVDALYRRLNELYADDYRLADLRDRSDLLLRFKGGAFEHEPRLQLVASLFDNVTNRITDLTKVILGNWADGRVTPASLDLSLSGIAKGSLILGLSADRGNSENAPLLGQSDTILVSTHEALQWIDVVAHVVERNDDIVRMEEISERIPNPKIRDAALLAVQRLAPSGRRNIESLAVSSASERPALLDSDHRRAIRVSLVKPVIHGEQITLSGHVREIDLDAHRFDLRGIDDHQIRDVRCAYRDLRVRKSDLLGSYVTVNGLVERAADGIPKLLSVLDLEIRELAPDELHQIDETETPLPFLKS